MPAAALWDIGYGITIYGALLLGFAWLTVLSWRVRHLHRRLALHTCRDAPEPGPRAEAENTGGSTDRGDHAVMMISPSIQPLTASRHHAALRTSFADRYANGATIARPAVVSGRPRGFVRQLLIDAGVPLRGRTPVGEVSRNNGVPLAQASLTGVPLC